MGGRSARAVGREWPRATAVLASLDGTTGKRFYP
jgi:hypothetical protein